MKKTSLTFLAALITLFAHAQTTQPCEVKQYNQKEQKTPLPGVEVMVSNAGTTVSDNGGKLTLAFRTLKPGDRVYLISAKKAGYELFNSEAVKQWNISRERTPFTLVLVKKEYFDQLKANLTRTSTDSYQRKYEQAVRELEKQKKAGKMKEEEFNRKYDELETQYQTQLSNLDNYIDQFSRIDLSEVSEEEQRILELVQEGKIDEAVQAYEEMELANKLRGEVDDYLEAGKAVRQFSEIRGQKKESIETLYSSISRECSTMILAHMYPNARDLLVSALDAFLLLMEEDLKTALPKVASFQYQLGDLIYNRSWFLKDDKRSALPYFESALSNYEVLEADSPGSYYKDIAQTMTDLGELAEYSTDLKGAESHYLGALEIWERHMGPEGEHRRQLASIQSLLGDLYKEWRGRGKDAERFYLAALDNYSILSQAEPDSFAGSMARIHRALASVYGSSLEFDKEEASLLEAERLYSQLSEKVGPIYLGSLQEAQRELANYYGLLMPAVKQGEDYAEKAEQYYLAVCKTALRKADVGEIASLSPSFQEVLNYSLKRKKHDSIVGPYISGYLTASSSLESSPWQDLIKFCMRRKDYQKAETYISEYLDLCDSRYPDDKERVQSRSSIGKAFFNTDYPEKALPYFRDAKDLYEQRWQEEYLDRGKLCVELAKCYALVDDPEQMAVAMSEAFRLFDLYCTTDPGDVSPELAIKLKLSIIAILNATFTVEVLNLEKESKMASLPNSEKRNDTALSKLDIYFHKEYAALIMRHAVNEYVRVAEAQKELADLYLNAEEHSAAERWYCAALETLENYKRDDPNGFSEYSLMADIQKDLGRLFFAKDRQKTENYLLQSLQNYTRAEEHYVSQIDTTISGFGKSRFDPNQFKKDMYYSQKILGFMYYNNKEDEKAEEYLVEAIKNHERHYNTHQNNSFSWDMLFDISETQYVLVLVLARLSKMDDYYKWLDFVLPNYEELYTAKPENITCKDRLGNLLLRKGRYYVDNDQADKAIPLLERVYEIDNARVVELASDYNAAAYSYARREQYEKALESINKAITMQQEVANYYDSKGEILLMMGDEKGAVEMWRKVMELDPDFLSSKQDGSTPLYEQLKDRGLID